MKEPTFSTTAKHHFPQFLIIYLNTLKKMIVSNFENMKINHIVQLGEGWISRAYLINHEAVFRFSKEKDGAMDTEKEIKALPNLKNIFL
ncbi:hypothetical protein [Lederbergia citrea]|uniref:hypothetical protein n=1 Tax=Lederbergia citrea TaxID=2833581 RepID=UPI001BC93141|nr:hypothetical protein [Lederbergia citrea]MBS4176859.1 hypothetical protein [Lederbergia citrea]